MKPSGLPPATRDRQSHARARYRQVHEIVGEAATKVSDESRTALPSVPWPDRIAMRHRLIHAYFDVNLDIVWDTVEVDLPPLCAGLDDWLGRHVLVELNDNGGLNTVANPWLEQVTLPCRMEGPRGLVFTVEATFKDRTDMFRVSPTTFVLAGTLGFSGPHLSGDTPVRFLAARI